MVHVARHSSRLKGRVKSHPRESLNHFHGAFLPGFLWSIILICLIQSLYLKYLNILPYATCISQPRWILLQKPMGRTLLDNTTHLTSQETFFTCVVGEVS